jgi:amidase
MQRITRDHYMYAFDPSIPPVAEVEAGERLILETHDSSTGRLKRREDLAYYLSVRKPKQVNPACGPLTVRGAEPGDGLNVAIESIALVPPGNLRASPGIGILPDTANEPAIVMVDVQGDTLVLDNGIRLPARPMVGVIGTAMGDRIITTADPGPNGSNMDCGSIRPGTVVHLPVWVPGAHFGLGDVHGAMGDAEATGGAVEISADVTVRIELVKGVGWQRPWWETDSAWFTYGFGPNLEVATREAVAAMTDHLQAHFKLPRQEAFMLISAYGDVRIGQAANCGLDVTSWVQFPKIRMV